MRLRLAIVAVALGLLSVLVSWATLGPMVLNAMALLGRVAPASTDLMSPRMMLAQFSLDVLVVAMLFWLSLYYSIGRSLVRAEQALDALQEEWGELNLSDSGPLALRLNRALRTFREALRLERQRSVEQVAALRQAHDDLLRMQADLVASDRLATVGKLASGVAHEVGNPLSGILGYLSLVRSRGRDAPEVIDLVERMEHEVQRIDGVVRALLELGRPSRAASQPVELTELVRSTLGLIGAMPEMQGVRVEVALPPSLFALAQSGPVSQVLVNLVLNGAQAMNGSGVLRVSGRAEGERVLLEVEDEGPGLTEEARARLFELFFTTKPAGLGTGLGLAVSRHLLSQFGGLIGGANRSDRPGARFTVSLPAVPAAGSAPRPQ